METPIIGNLWIINVNNSPNQDLNTTEILEKNPQNVFICGDFNSPHQELNCTYNIENGEKLLEIIDEGKFNLMNNGYPTYQSNQHKSQSMIDLHFCSLSVLEHFDNFQVLEDFGGDHSATLTSLKLKLQVEFDLKAKIDFKKFRKHAKVNYKNSCLYPPKYPNKNNLNETSHNIIEVIHISIDQSYVNKTNIQISPEIIKLIKQRKMIRRQLKRAKDDNFYRLRKEINFLQREIRRAFKRSIERQNRKLIETTKQAGNKGFWKAIKTITSDKQQSSGSHLQITFKDKIAITDHEKFEFFKSLLSETMIEHQYENEDLQKHFETEQNTKRLIETEPKEITAEKIFLKVEEFNEILKNTSKSCPGPDKISYQLLKALAKSIKDLICIIISSPINNFYVPCLWKDSQVTMLRKPQKDKKKAENYRPISLTNCIAKVCETVVKKLILDHCEANKVFGPQQSAYRANRRTTDNLLVLTQHISETYQWSEMVGLVCLDVEKAFDAVWRLGLIDKMIKIRIQTKIIKWLNSFLSQRNVYVKIKNTRSEKFSPTAGVPQGSVVAPILFLIFVSNIPETPAEISQFADDFALFYRSKCSQLIQSKLQASLNTLIKWCDKLKIKINPAKTKYMLFKNPSKRQTSISLNINGKQIEEAKTMKFLGITMTPQLNWNEHCKDITSRENKRIFQLQRLSNLNVEQKSLLLLYKSWIRPLFLYANACWLNQSQTVISIMQNAQNRALRICLRKPRWYSVQKLHEESNSPTTRNIQIRLANEYIKRAQKNKIEAILRLIEKKRQCPKNNCKSTLDFLID